jgi:hypothetical protein
MLEKPKATSMDALELLWPAPSLRRARHDPCYKGDSCDQQRTVVYAAEKPCADRP